MRGSAVPREDAEHTFQSAETNPLKKTEWGIRVIPCVIPKSQQRTAALFSHNTTTPAGPGVKQLLGLYFQ